MGINRRTLLIVLFVVVAALHSRAIAEIIAVQGKGLNVQVDSASGDYRVSRQTPAWPFAGSIGQPLVNAGKQAGTDKLGAYNSITFEWQSDGPKAGEIRAYTDRALVQFILTCKSAQTKPPAAFPTLQPPKGLHLFSYDDATFAGPRFEGRSGGTPWLMFDDDANAAILSPASNFMIASVHSGKTVDETKTLAEATTAPTASPTTTRAATRATVDRRPRKTEGEISSDLVTKLIDLPEGFSHSTVLAFGDGINATWNTWGKALTDLTGKNRPANDADTGLKYFGYWTDNGASYYYNYDPKLGYEGTLLALNQRMKELNIPLGYLQLDSWWYHKSFTDADGKEGKPFKNDKLPRGTWNAYGGLLEYVAHKDLFPDGLPAFREKIGLPFVTHNRWVDLKSPYRGKYKISGVAAIDPKWWNDIVDYLKSSGVVTYEQDWLDRIYKYSPEFQTTHSAGDAFMDNMSRATKERGLTMQYCMELPRHYLQGSKYDNLTTVRVAGDRFERGKWEPSLYVSAMAAALGEWPWVDTFESHETSNLILANLTAGMVGVGDKIDKIDAANIRKVIRADGVIVKPDTPIVPIDQTYVNDANSKDAPLIAAAYTNNGPLRTAYVFAYPRNAKQMNIQFRSAELGVIGDAMVYDPINGSAEKVAAHGAFDATFKETAPKLAWAYYIVTPITRSGIALIGDKDRFVSLGKQRIDQVQETFGGINARVLFAPGEKQVTLHGFAAGAPQVKVDGGKTDDLKFDAGTHEFTVSVSPAVDGAAVSVAFVAK